MEAYSDFARVYDLFMEQVPYDLWTKRIDRELKEAGITDGIVADLGCGTGNMTRRLAACGYDMIGIDNSYDMLSVAQGAGSDGILYLMQDMREFELYGTVGAVVSCCDSLNYILEEDELLTVFELVNNYLDPGGVFIFDMNMPYKYETLLSDNTFAENSDEGSFIWENSYDIKTGINNYELTLYIREEDDSYSRFEESHFQKSYEPRQIKELLKKAGLEVLKIYDAEDEGELRENTERAVFVARLPKNTKKRTI